MRWFDAARARLHLLLGRHAAESRMDEEFRFHLEMETAKNLRDGMSAGEARRRAAVAFGGVERHREEMREGRGLAWLGGWSLDLRLGLRMLARYPGLAIVGGLGMALATAIGAGSYAVMNSYFYPELPLHEGNRVVLLANWNPQLEDADSWRPGDFVTLRRELRSIRDLGAFRNVRRNRISATGQGEPITVAEMTASGFRVARVAPLLGRTLLDADERPGAPNVVVIGRDVWMSRYGGDSTIVGRPVRLGRELYTVVGVMPDGFGFPVSHSWWIPLRVEQAAAASASAPELQLFGRLAPGVTEDAAQAELVVVAHRLEMDRSTPRAALLQPRLLPYPDIVAEGEGATGSKDMLLIEAVISLLLVLVALNVAVLVYARTVARTREIAVRTALGASRGRVVTQLFAEALVLSVLSSLVGLGIVALALRSFDHIIALVSGTGRAPFWIHPGLSAGTIAYALGLAVLGAAIVGILPALRATGAQLRAAMGGVNGGAQPQLGRTWTAFIVLQVAIAVAALPPALFQGRQLAAQAMQPPGFHAGEILAARFSVGDEDADVDPGMRADSVNAAARLRATQNSLLARLADAPGVVSASMAERIPGAEPDAHVDVEGGATNVSLRAGRVAANWFELMGARIVAGRGFGPGDAALAASRPVIVNRSFVVDVLGGGVAVGRRLRDRSAGDSARPWLEIVGVVEDFPAGYRNPGETGARLYRLTTPGELRTGVALVRLRGQSPPNFAPTLQRIVTSVDPTLLLTRVAPLAALYTERGQLMGLLALVVALVAGSVLLLSAAGIHALMSFTVNQRRREIGIRAALGADARRLLWSVLRRALRQLAVGVSAGLALALVVERWSGGEIMGGHASLVVPLVAALMALVGLLAALGPARRGLRVQPTEALQADV